VFAIQESANEQKTQKEKIRQNRAYDELFAIGSHEMISRKHKEYGNDPHARIKASDREQGEAGHVLNLCQRNTSFKESENTIIAIQSVLWTI